jgi:hypothetical protein
MREALYKAEAKAAEANLRKTGAWGKLSAERKRPVKKMLLDGKRVDLALEKKTRRSSRFSRTNFQKCA